MPELITAQRRGFVGFWAAYVELAFSATTAGQLDTTIMFLKYHIQTALSQHTDFSTKLEQKTAFCFKFASQPRFADRKTFEKCVQLSMDLLYAESLELSGKPPVDVTGLSADSLRHLEQQSEIVFQSCLNQQDPSERARKCRLAAAVRTEWRFLENSLKSQSTV